MSKKHNTNPNNSFNKKQYQYDTDANAVQLFCHNDVHCDTGRQKGERWGWGIEACGPQKTGNRFGLVCCYVTFEAPQQI